MLSRIPWARSSFVYGSVSLPKSVIRVGLTFLRVLARFGSSSPDQASRMATPSVEREQTDQETPRTVPETQQELVRRLLGEVSEMRKENQKLQSEVATLKANVTKRRLFRQPKEDNDPECSVSYLFS